MRTRTRFVPFPLLAVLLVGALAAARPARADEPKDDPHAGLGRAEAILQGLAQGIEALQMLGGHEEEIARLRKIRGHVAQRVANARRERAEKGEAREDEGGIEARGDDDETRALGRRAVLLRLALRALKAAEKHDAAEIAERAIRTAELLLHGRHDAEAQAVYDRTPKLAHLSEVLQMAAHLWAKQGHENDAAGVAELARYYARRAKQQAAEEEDEGDEDDDEMEGDDDDEDENTARAQVRAAEEARVKALEARAREDAARSLRERAEQARRATVEAQVVALRVQLAEMQKMLEKLRAELEALSK